MPRPRIYDEDHFRLSTYRNKAGKTYIYGYRNEWNKEKRQSRVVNRQYVGTLDPKTGKAKLGPKFLAAHPEYVGKDLYYQDNELIERDAVWLEEANELDDCIFSDNLSVGATWACWETARQAGVYSDLCKIFGKEDGSNLLRLGIYQYLTGKTLSGFEDWIPDVYLPDAEELSEQNINELLARVDYAKMHAFFRIHSDRRKKAFGELSKKESQKCLSGKPQFLAICAKGLPMFSNKYEGNDQESEYRQTDLILVVDFSSGDICYAFECDGLINKQVPCQQVLKDMQRGGFDLTNTVFVKDQEVGFERRTNSDFQYIYRWKEDAEKAYRRFTIQDVGVEPYEIESIHVGKLLVHLLAQNLRMILLASAQKNQKQFLLSDSTDKAMAILCRVRAQRSPGRDVWLTGEIPQKAQEFFGLLGVALPPKKFEL